MKLTSSSFPDGGVIPGEFAFGIVDPATHVALSSNRNPQLAWSDLPPATRSLALLCCDHDVPAHGEDVNQEGKSLPADMARTDFFHWVLVDLPPLAQSIAAGQFSSAVTARGKQESHVGGDSFAGARQGINDYTNWFAGDADMSGDYYGYDGPCPPWNDERVHRYVFTLYALDVAHAPVVGKFTGAQALAAIQPNIIAQASITGTYTLNPALAKP